MSVLALTTRERAIARLGGLVVGKWGEDQLADLDLLIQAISQSFEQRCSHGFAIEARQESRILNRNFLPCYGWPVVSIQSVSASYSGRSADMISLSAGAYEIAPNQRGIMVWDAPSGSTVRYTTTGGIAVDTDAVHTNEPNLEDICLIQLVAEWKRKNNPDKTGIDMGGGTTRWDGELHIIKDVDERLDQEYVSQVDFL
jgi:hypothetical protein